MADTESNPEIQRPITLREIYDCGMLFARSGETTWLGDYYRAMIFDDRQWLFQTIEPNAGEGIHKQPVLTISRRYQDEDGRWWPDIHYDFDPQDPEFAHVNESITIKGVAIADLPDNPHDAPLHQGLFSTLSGSEHTYITERIRDRQPLTDTEEVISVVLLVAAAVKKL